MRPVLVPSSFAQVERGVFRSSYPSTPAHVPYLRQLGLRTVAVLSIEDLPPLVRKALVVPLAATVATASTPLAAAVQSSPSGPAAPAPPASSPPSDAAALCPPPTLIHLGRQHCRAVTSGSSALDAVTSDDFVPRELVRHALDLIFDATVHPLLLMCPTGDVETNVVVGCARRYMSWCLSSIFGECQLFSSSFRGTILTQIEIWDTNDFLIGEGNITQRKRERLGGPGAAYASITSGTSDCGDESDRLTAAPIQQELSPSFRRTLPSDAADIPVLPAVWPTWYSAIVAMQQADAHLMTCEQMTPTAAQRPPHEVFRWTKNPPALDPRSTFSATDSIVEEDDD